MRAPQITVATPVYQAETCVEELYRRLVMVLESTGKTFEIIMVDDGSRDRSFEIIQRLGKADPRLRGFRLSRNFGQHATITACLDLSRGEHVVLMDCDLQDPPEEIPKFFQAVSEGYDIVLGKRQARQDGFTKQLGSKLFYLIFNSLTGVDFDRDISGFSLLNRKVVESLKQLREYPRFYIALIHWVGFRVKKVEIQHAANESRASTYTLRKLLKLALDACITYSDRPLKFSVKVGFLMSAISLLVGVGVYILALTGHVQVSGWASVMVSMYFLGGLIICNLGVMGMYIGRIMDQQKGRPIYLLSETTEAEISR